MESTRHPHQIEDGAGTITTFTGVKSDERGDVLGVDGVVPERDQGPPLHVHHLQHETVTVEQGSIGWQEAGGPEHHAGVGETVTFSPGVAHRFWNAGDEPLRLTGEVWPPNNFEYFLTGIYESTERNGGSRPGLFDAAFLSTRYRTEFEMLEIPTPVRKVLMPVLYQVGKLLGKHQRFADAPEPVRA